MNNRMKVSLLVIACVFLGGEHLSYAALAKKEKERKEVSEEQLLAAARQIDKYVAEIYKKKNAEIPADASDSVFLRRSFLLAAGRIPTVDEARVYLESEDPNKRILLVRYLMNSKGYQSHMSNWLLDMLRVKEKFQRRYSAAPYVDWVRQAVADNMPYDVMTRELLSAEGMLWENGAVGYYINDKGMPFDNMSNTMRLFLGTRMECAQCHDDPFNDWERMDFFQLAAFTNGQGEMNRDVFNPVWRNITKEFERGTPTYNMYDFIGNNIYYQTLSGPGNGRIKLPHDYQYSDGDPGEMIAAKTPKDHSFARGLKMSDRKDADDGRKAFAEWVTDRDNDRFVMTITNRMWKRIVGTALYEPFDEYMEENETTSPAMTRYLKKLMQDLDYDLRAFQHVLMLTRVYAFASSEHELMPGEKPIFDGRKIGRMTAEQYWDSLVTLVAGNPDKLPTRGKPKYVKYGKAKLDMKELQSEIIAIQEPGELKKYIDQLFKRVQSGETIGSTSMEKMEKMDEMSMEMMSGSNNGGALRGMVRASELPSPAPAGHLLRMFGQSDRLLLDSATKEPNAAQVLAMMNGQIEKLVVANPDARIYELSEGSDQDRIRSLFYGILSRAPSEAEMQIMEAEVQERGKSGYRNIVSALVNSREFIFVP
ncbi:MAG: DUF1549 domain-containing protein [Akkermansiaceae bacterium]